MPKAALTVYLSHVWLVHKEPTESLCVCPTVLPKVDLLMLAVRSSLNPSDSWGKRFLRMTKRFLILTADTGMGHRSTANAIRAALQEQHGHECTIDIVNPMDHRAASPLLRNSQADYDKMVREMPDLYQFGYKTLSDPLPNNLIESVFTIMLFEAVRDILKQYQPGHTCPTAFTIASAQEGR